MELERPWTVLVLAAAVAVLGPDATMAQGGTAFTYQGRLMDGASAATGSYDFQFTLFDDPGGGAQVGSWVKSAVPVAAGLFTVGLDFGPGAFTGNARWLEIGVRPGGSSGEFTTLTPRQELTPTPGAVFSQAVPWSGVTGKPAGFADDVDNDSGGDITRVAAGSGLSGGGTTGDVTLALDTATTDGRYVLKSGDTMTGTLTLNPAAGVGLSTPADINLGGRVLRSGTPFIQASTPLASTALGEDALASNAGTNNTGTGYHALWANSTGTVNTATGHNALWSNTTGNYNTAIGGSALPANTTGTNNTATGFLALQQNIDGNANTATGAYALQSNTGGGSNVAIGQGALHENTVGGGNVAAGYSAGHNMTGNSNIAIGYDAGSSATTGSNNVYIANPGVAEEGNTIRVGTSGTHTGFFAAGISGTPVSPASLVGVTGVGQLGTVAAGAGSGLDADMVDGQHASVFMGASVDNWVNTTGDAMTGTLALNPAVGVALSTTADVDLQGRVLRGSVPFIQANTSLQNTAIGENALQNNSTGSSNAATGWQALRANTIGYWNTATGSGALQSNTTGNANTATGWQALRDNTSGTDNVAAGHNALFMNTTGFYNTAEGANSLGTNTTGSQNTSTGHNALSSNTTGRNNIALGASAGSNATTGNYTIYIGHLGVAAEGNTIRIGTSGEQGRFFAAGIRGVTTGSADAVPVLVDSSGQLGTVSSSIRFKEDVRDMSDTSAALLQLRPVTFRYKGRPDVPEERHYGLIAEEVNEVIPELVAHSADGQIETVKYQELPAMLLNELQKQQRRAEAQDEEIRGLRAIQEQLIARLTRLESR